MCPVVRTQYHAKIFNLLGGFFAARPATAARPDSVTDASSATDKAAASAAATSASTGPSSVDSSALPLPTQSMHSPSLLGGDEMESPVNGEPVDGSVSSELPDIDFDVDVNAPMVSPLPLALPSPSPLPGAENHQPDRRPRAHVAGQSLASAREAAQEITPWSFAELQPRGARVPHDPCHQDWQFPPSGEAASSSVAPPVSSTGWLDRAPPRIGSASAAAAGSGALRAAAPPEHDVPASTLTTPTSVAARLRSRAATSSSTPGRSSATPAEHAPASASALMQSAARRSLSSAFDSPTPSVAADAGPVVEFAPWNSAPLQERAPNVARDPVHADWYFSPLSASAAAAPREVRGWLSRAPARIGSTSAAPVARAMLPPPPAPAVAIVLGPAVGNQVVAATPPVRNVDFDLDLSKTQPK